MSISRIESSYAYFLDRKISLTQMAVLQALAYHANEETEECHPSNATLAREVHTSVNTVGAACKALKRMGAIDWVRGGQYDGVNIANVNSFLFPRTKMPSRRERYESILTKRGVPKYVAPRTQPTMPPSPSTMGTGTPAGGAGVPIQLGSNTEYNPNPKANIKSESNVEVCPTPDSEFKFLGCSERGNDESVVYDREHTSPLKAALFVCKTRDKQDIVTFGHLMEHRSWDRMFDVIEEFWSEIKVGDHDKLRNRAAELTKRLMNLPQVEK